MYETHSEIVFDDFVNLEQTSNLNRIYPSSTYDFGDFWPYIENYLEINKQLTNNKQIIIKHPLECHIPIHKHKYIFDYIHEYCDNSGWNKNKFKFITGNWRIFESYSVWKTNNNYVGEEIQLECDFELAKWYAPMMLDTPNKYGVIPELDYCDQLFTQDKQWTFNCLNRGPQVHRVNFVQELWRQGLLADNCVTFNFDPSSQTEQIESFTGHLQQEFLDLLPLEYDKPQDQSALQFASATVMPQAYHQIDNFEHNRIPNWFEKFYKNSWLTVTTESYTSLHVVAQCFAPDCKSLIDPVNMMCLANNHPWEQYEHHNKNQNPLHTIKQNFNQHRLGFVTEKTFRNFLNLHPTIWVASPGTTLILKQLGFETFSDYWDESYDYITNPIDRQQTITELLKQLSSYSQTEWRKLQKSMTDTLLHNQNIMLTMTDTPKISQIDHQLT